MTNAHPQAPGELELVRQFVNTLDVESAADQLPSPEGLRAWYVDKGLIDDAGTKFDSADLAEAIAVREALRSLLYANHDETVDPAAVAVLNRALGRRPYFLQVPPSGIGPLRLAGGRDKDGLAGLMAVVFRAMADGTWSRLKICRNDTCRWAFYDYSKNRSGSWCSMAVCGNRRKVRAYQARAKAKKAQAQQ